MSKVTRQAILQRKIEILENLENENNPNKLVSLAKELKEVATLLLSFPELDIIDYEFDPEKLDPQSYFRYHRCSLEFIIMVMNQFIKHFTLLSDKQLQPNVLGNKTHTYDLLKQKHHIIIKNHTTKITFDIRLTEKFFHTPTILKPIRF